MTQRCNDTNHVSYKRYGGAGIKVCKEWRDFSKFYSDMGPRPAGMTIDRIDNKRGYKLDNCRWATYSQQLLNRKNTRVCTLNGETKPLKEWCSIKNMQYATVRLRIKRGWPIDAALNYKPDKSNQPMKRGEFK
jgi:hypothetical protein